MHEGNVGCDMAVGSLRIKKLDFVDSSRISALDFGCSHHRQVLCSLLRDGRWSGDQSGSGATWPYAMNMIQERAVRGWRGQR